MKKLMTIALFIGACLQIASAQGTNDANGVQEAMRAARKESQITKSQFANLATLTPADFNDTASFGKTVKFLGSLYAGTVFVYHSCDPTVLLNDLGIVMAADDHCVVHTTPGPSTTATIFDDVWQITIPGKTVDNVVYPMLNNGVGYQNNGLTTGAGFLLYSPKITIVSDALNDPAAIDPTTGLPMGGSFTTSLAGSRLRNIVFAGGETDFDNYASVSGRGFSRTYFQSLGLPQTVIDNLYKKPMTLKFGIRVTIGGAIDYGQFYYTFRLLGN
jgi:hypothetical protein